MKQLRNHYNMSTLVNFKEVYSSRILQMVVYLQITVTEFINDSKGLLATHFGINEDDLEIVLSGQYSEELPSEAMPALMPSDITLSELWGDRLHNIAFYIRRKNQVYPHANRVTAPIGDQLDNPLHTQMHTNICVDDCPICLEHGELVRRYACSHGICTTCYVGCINSNITNCSLCRAF
jgi:hypothetical protein